MLTFKQISAASAAVLVALLSCGCDDTPVVKPVKTPKVEAVATTVAQGGVCVEAEDFGATGTISTDWVPGEAIGVYASGNKNVKYTNGTGGQTVEFTTTSTFEDEPQVAYYPYSTSNNNREYFTLRGEVPATQSVSSTVNCVYRYGENNGAYTDGVRFTFHELLPYIHVKISAAGTDIKEDEVLESATLTVTRDGAAVPLCGEFVFNGADGSNLKATSTASQNEINLDWGKKATLEDVLSGYITILPEIRVGDELCVEVVTNGHKATYSTKATVDVEPGFVYTLPLALSKFDITKLAEDVKTGKFTCATYNVDGLPKRIGFITINPDGPGAEGTVKMAAKIAADDWDFFGVSEDFTNHSTLVSGLPEFTFGTYGGNYATRSTDGINLAWRSGDKVSATNETRVKFSSSYGGLTAGANTSITKGFRYYLVTLEDGTQIDVYITHMNTYSSSGTGHINAQHAQLSQIANYIIAHRNGRPAILMGDTNLRYTRHKIKELFIDAINAVDGLTVADPWIEYPRGGVYPDYPGKSIMAYPTTDPDDDCGADGNGYGYYYGEVVDKVFYINDSAAPTQIKANGYLCDKKGYDGLADHYPVVIEFSYTTKK